MWVDIFLASLWGGVVSLDTTALLQIMISRPIVACSVTGLILGNFPLGFFVGILLELLYISELPVGAAKFAESNVGSAAAAAITILTTAQLPDRPYITLAAALIVTVPISSFGGRLVLLMRRINGVVYEKMLYKKHLAPRDINLAQLFGVGMAFLIGFISVLISTAFFVNLLSWLLAFVPENYDKIFQPAMGSVLAAGCIFLAQLFWEQNQKKKWLFFLGVGLGLVLFLKYL